MKSILTDLITFIESKDGINDKAGLTDLVSRRFDLTCDRSVYYSDDFAIRFCKAQGPNLSNTVLSLSNLSKVDDRPFMVCVVTPKKNYLYLSNSTFLIKISHSSQQLRVNNIKGSFNGSDIMKSFNGLRNEPKNFDYFFRIHEQVGFDGNLERLVAATNDIHPLGQKAVFDTHSKQNIMSSPSRAQEFVSSIDYQTLKKELDDQVSRFQKEILIAALIENVNIRGAVIEYLIAGEDEALRSELIRALKSGKGSIPKVTNKHSLGDYTREFEKYMTETDVKTKIMILNSNPKAYNIDKMLDFLSTDKSVFMFYFVGLDFTRKVNTTLTSMFQLDLCNTIIILSHWAGRNSRGVTQFEGKIIKNIIMNPNNNINIAEAQRLLNKFIDL